MNLLSRYIWKHALGGILMAWVALVMLDSFFALINELDDVSGDNNYGATQVVIYMVYTLPQRFYDHFPTSILVGALLGLGRLSSNSEFTAMRAAGMSVAQIVLATLQLGVMLAVLTFVMGEWVVPVTDRHAVNFKALQKDNKVAVTADRGLWVKESREIIKIENVVARDTLSDITIYRLGDNYRNLEELTFIKEARYIDHEWELQDVTRNEFTESGIVVDKVALARTKKLVDPGFLDVTVVKPEQLSSQQLKKIIEHQDANKLNSSKFKLEYWKHYSLPFSALVTLMLAMPFLFSSQRSVNMGQRIFIGIVVGIAFYLSNRVLNEVGLVYNMPPFMSAFFPVLLFLGISLITLKRIR